MLTLIFTHPREDYVRPSRLLASIFFCVFPTPARWLQGRLWAEWSGESSPGSLVLNGTGGRTAKRLKSLGSVVLFRNLTRDACADACLCARTREGQKHGFTEPKGFIIVCQSVISSLGVLYWFCSGSDGTAPCAAVATAFATPADGRRAAARRIKISGEYAPAVFAASIQCDPGLNGATAGANFRRRARGVAGLAGAVAGSIEVGAAACGNGGNQPFLGGAIGHVGTPMLERRQKTSENRASAAVLRQPAGLAGLGLASCQTPPGVDAASRGGTPPSRPRVFSRPWAQPVFQVSTNLEIRGLRLTVMDPNSRLCSKSKMGSGVARLPAASSDRSGHALDVRQQDRVGEQGAFSSWGRSLETGTLWGGLHGVN